VSERMMVGTVRKSPPFDKLRARFLPQRARQRWGMRPASWTESDRKERLFMQLPGSRMDAIRQKTDTCSDDS
jgi:hypothetical protein